MFCLNITHNNITNGIYIAPKHGYEHSALQKILNLQLTLHNLMLYNNIFKLKTTKTIILETNVFSGVT